MDFCFHSNRKDAIRMMNNLSCFYSVAVAVVSEMHTDCGCGYVFNSVVSIAFTTELYVYIYTREIPAFGRISLALRGNGATGAAFRAPSAPRLGRTRRPV